ADEGADRVGPREARGQRVRRRERARRDEAQLVPRDGEGGAAGEVASQLTPVPVSPHPGESRCASCRRTGAARTTRRRPRTWWHQAEAPTLLACSRARKRTP